MYPTLDNARLTVSIQECQCDLVSLFVQEAWIQHATVKENILFGQPFDPEKYSAVVFACALEQVGPVTCQGVWSYFFSCGISGMGRN